MATFNNFNDYAESIHSKLKKAPRKISFSTYDPNPSLPHVPGNLTQQNLESQSAINQDRATTEPVSGEVVGTDVGTGESLVRVPGSKVVRVAIPDTSPGSTVSFTADPDKTAAYQRIRKSGVTISRNTSGLSRNKTGKLEYSTRTSLDERDLLLDPCTPPDVKAKIMQGALDAGLPISNTGEYLAIGNIRQLDSLRQQIDAFVKQSQEEGKAASIPQTLSTGNSTANQDYRVGLPLLWKCVGNECVLADDGFYLEKSQCEANCGATSWICQSGVCVEIPGLSGQFTSAEECSNEGCYTNYRCVGGECVPDKDGPFTSLENCQNSGCFWGFSCIGGSCIPTVGGQYKSKKCCELKCEAIGPSTLFYGSKVGGINPKTGANFSPGSYSTSFPTSGTLTLHEKCLWVVNQRVDHTFTGTLTATYKRRSSSPPFTQATVDSALADGWIGTISWQRFFPLVIPPGFTKDFTWKRMSGANQLLSFGIPEGFLLGHYNHAFQTRRPIFHQLFSQGQKQLTLDSQKYATLIPLMQGCSWGFNNEPLFEQGNGLGEVGLYERSENWTLFKFGEDLIVKSPFETLGLGNGYQIPLTTANLVDSDTIVATFDFVGTPPPIPTFLGGWTNRNINCAEMPSAEDSEILYGDIYPDTRFFHHCFHTDLVAYNIEIGEDSSFEVGPDVESITTKITFTMASSPMQGAAGKELPGPFNPTQGWLNKQIGSPGNYSFPTCV